MARIDRLVLHVGHYKTGTTALQDDLGTARGSLRRQGVHYPKAGSPGPGHANQSAIAFQMFTKADMHVPNWYTRTKAYRQFVDGKGADEADELVREVRSARPSTVIVSSEEFMRFGFGKVMPPDIPRAMIRQLRPRHVTVVAYLRRPDRYLDSWYNQLIKLATAQKRLATSVRRFFGGTHTAYDRGLRYWRDDVGCDELVVRDYDELEGGAITSDFEAATGIQVPLDASAAPRFSNPRIDNNFIEYARRRAVAAPHESARDLHRLLASIKGADGYPPLEKVDVLGTQARRELYDYFVPVNERLGELSGRGDVYFRDLDQMLEVPSGAITDMQAYRIWAPHLDAAVREAGLSA